jgi:protein O-mannosyl-transferase
MSKKKAPKKPVLTRTPWIVSILCLVTIALIAYWNSFGAPLVFDDSLTIQRNADVRFGEFHWNVLAPRAVLYLTFTLNYIWSGQDVWSYHLVNFILHILNGLLVFGIAESVFRRIDTIALRSRMYAGFAAAFFLVHPVQTESVTYISSRSELLSTSFYLLGLLIFALMPERRIGFLCSLAVGVPFLFGLGSKETVITLPATIFLYDFLFLSKAEIRPVLSRWRFWLTYLMGGLAASIYLLTLPSLRGALNTEVTPWRYFLTETRVIVRYIQLIFMPVGLNLDYDFRISSSLFEPSVIASIIFLGGVLFLGWKLRRTAPVFSFSILWFFIALSPTSSVIPIFDVIFEHRLYLPMVGICMSFPLFVEWIYAQTKQRILMFGTPVAWSTAIVIALTIGTVMRNQVWSDEVGFFKDVVAKSPAKERAYNGLMWAYYKRGEFDRAVDVLQSGIGKIPNTIDVYDTLANLYLKTGKYDQAIEFFKKTTESYKGDQLALAYNNIGVAYLYMWNDFQTRRAQISPEEFAARTEQLLAPSADAFMHGLKIQPNMPWSLDSYVNVMYYRGRVAEIEKAATERLKGKETFADLYTLGRVALHNTDYAKADQFFERAEKLNKDAKILFFNHGLVLTQLMQDERAIEKYIQAIRIDPIFIEAHHNLGLIYMRRSEFVKAEEAFVEVLRQDPKHVSSNLNLGYIYMVRGNKILARTYLRTVLDVSPGNEQAVAMLNQLGS